MAIKKAKSGWQVDIQPGGRNSTRYRKKLPTKSEALAYEAWLKTKLTQTPEWEPQKKDHRHLTDLVKSWYSHHGNQLRAGKDTYSRLLAMCDYMGDPIAEKFTAAAFSNYRSKRLEAGVSANNMNREHAYLRAVFNELGRIGEWEGVNPLSKLRQFKIEERELSYLTLDQINKLLKALSEQGGDCCLIAKVCLSTGARWSEAEGLRRSQVRSGQIAFSKTKSGKNRSVPISEELTAELEAKVNPGFGENIFKRSYEDFSRGIDAAGIELPKGQLTHVLRHSFASHFMINGGNILTLQKILGHSTILMTMKYAHLAPDHLQEAKKLNPLAALTLG